MRFDRRLTITGLLALVLLLPAGCNKPSGPGGDTSKVTDNKDPQEKPPEFAGEKSGKIKIVSSLPRTGSAKGQSDTIVNGIKLALDEVGHKVGDFTIEYEDLDDATATAGSWDAQRETQNANK